MYVTCASFHKANGLREVVQIGWDDTSLVSNFNPDIYVSFSIYKQ